ncbi:PepSY domain-containing protein, partial [Streptomyces carpinensis]
LGGAGAASAVAFTDDDHDSTQAGASTTAGTRHDDHDDHNRSGSHDDHNRSGSHDDHNRSGSHDDADDGALAKGTGVDLKQAVDTAAKSVAGTVTEVELDGQHSKAVWKVHIVDGKGAEYEVAVNTADGRTTTDRAHHGEDADDHGDAALAKSAGTSLGQAVDRALDKVPGTATAAEFDHDHGRTGAWHVDIADSHGIEHEVAVDTRTGKVTTTHAARGNRGGKGTDDDRERD